MSRGLGTKQSLVLIALADWDWTGQSWIAWTYLDLSTDDGDRGQGMARSKAERASWRRAIRSLETRGLVECRTDARQGYEPDDAGKMPVLQVRLTNAGIAAIDAAPRLFGNLPLLTRMKIRLHCGLPPRLHLKCHGSLTPNRRVWTRRAGAWRAIEISRPRLLLRGRTIGIEELVATPADFMAVAPEHG